MQRVPTALQQKLNAVGVGVMLQGVTSSSVCNLSSLFRVIQVMLHHAERLSSVFVPGAVDPVLAKCLDAFDPFPQVEAAAAHHFPHAIGC